MSALLSITEGWTQELGPFTLRVNTLPLSLSGLVVMVVLRDSKGSLFTPGGTVRVDPDQVANKGQVYYKPVAGDFKAGPGPYHLHWQVTNGIDVVFFPSAAASEVAVYPR